MCAVIILMFGAPFAAFLIGSLLVGPEFGAGAAFIVFVIMVAATIYVARARPPGGQR